MTKERREYPRIILYTGKGGTGKSVISCITGLKTAKLGYKTLLISSDPAHTLGDAFGLPVRDEPTLIVENLWAQQMDPVKETVDNYGVVQDFIVEVFQSQGMDETLAYELASLPVMTSLFALLKIEEVYETNEYEVLILDTVPTGESLKSIFFPKVFGSISKKFLKLIGSLNWAAKALSPLIGMPAPDREVIETETRLITRFEKLGDILSDTNITSLRLVSNPDTFSINNMRRAFITSNLYGINVDLAIINKVLPDKITDPFFEKWMVNQKEIMTYAENSFYPLPIKKMKLFDSELKGIEMLNGGTQELFKNEDPSQIYYLGNPIETVREGNQLLIKIQAPFVDKDACEVERVGDEAIVKICSDVGDSVNVIPLPAITHL
ncbi:TRC40/GET3/ArsA family transport-energizing ATPase, partial [Thermoproteota archaeon]